MCGIAGFIDPVAERGMCLSVLDRMLERIAHRGPDARGTWHHGSAFLGHNRLSIIDLSEEANQPMLRNTLTLTFNGEIYNYLEIQERLKKKGHVFTTRSDSEVILAAYKEWGPECVREFIGMWAFVIYDTQTGTLFASRDRFGIKPLYYIRDGSRFYFGSEFKALRESPLFSNEINVQQVSRGLQLGWTCFQDETYFEKIKALPAAHNLLFRDGSLSVSRYWDIETGRYSTSGFEEKKKEFLQLFTESIRLHMRSDVPVGSCLSGGLDSSAIVSMVQKMNPGIQYKTFSIYYEGKGDVDERPFISEVIKQYPGIEPFYFSPTDSDVEESFHHALYHADVPCTGSSFLSQYFLMKLIGSHKIKVVLDGQGSDEFLAGYMHTYYRIIADLLKKSAVLPALGLTRDINRALGAGLTKAVSHFGKSMLCRLRDEQDLYGLEYRNYYPFLTAQKGGEPFMLERKPGNKTDNFLYHLIFNTSLPSLLQYEDRNSMAFSIESRVPFLDHRLVEFAFHLTNEDKIKGTETKYILRKALSGILPEAIAQRKDKKGFVTPGENKWLRGPLRFLLDDQAPVAGFLKKDLVKNLNRQYQNGDNSKAVIVWRLATLNYWMKNFVN